MNIEILNETFSFDESDNNDREFVWKRVDDDKKKELTEIYHRNKVCIAEVLFDEGLGTKTNKVILAINRNKIPAYMFRLYENYSDDFGEGYIRSLLDTHKNIMIVIKAVKTNNKMIFEFINTECRKPILVVEVSYKKDDR